MRVCLYMSNTVEKVAKAGDGDSPRHIMAVGIGWSLQLGRIFYPNYFGKTNVVKEKEL